MCGRKVLLAATYFLTLDRTTKWLIHRFSDEGFEVVDDLLVVEQEITLSVNGEKILSTGCSLRNLRELAYGYLLSAGMIRTTDDVISDRKEEGAIPGCVRPFGWQATCRLCKR